MILGTWVYDARSLAAAQANRAIGGGFEDYKSCKVNFCDIENIHVVRDSWKSLLKLCSSCDDGMWHAKLNETSLFFFLFCLVFDLFIFRLVDS